jgi:hypothetical protein
VQIVVSRLCDLCPENNNICSRTSMLKIITFIEEANLFCEELLRLSQFCSNIARAKIQRQHARLQNILQLEYFVVLVIE